MKQQTPMERNLLQNIAKVKQQNYDLARRQESMGFSVTERHQAQRAMGTPPCTQDPSYMAQEGSYPNPVAARRQWWMAPGNVGDLNSVIWDYFFVVPPTLVAPQSTVSTNFLVNQTASFVWKEFTKVVFVQTVIDDAVSLTYLDPEAPADLGFAPGVSITLQNVSATTLYTPAPIALDQLGSPQDPFILPAPLMLMPNSSVGIQIGNANPTVTYFVGLAALGYRLRIQNQNQIMSLVTQG